MQYRARYCSNCQSIGRSGFQKVNISAPNVDTGQRWKHIFRILNCLYYYGRIVNIVAEISGIASVQNIRNPKFCYFRKKRFKRYIVIIVIADNKISAIVPITAIIFDFFLLYDFRFLRFFRLFKNILDIPRISSKSRFTWKSWKSRVSRRLQRLTGTIVKPMVFAKLPKPIQTDFFTILRHTLSDRVSINSLCYEEGIFFTLYEFLV